ncbi:hypothetical protein PTKIN_Ptkin06aG0112000 [Pterospermum kingtungense]
MYVRRTMSRNASQLAVDSQFSKRTNRKWSYDEDVLLASSMVNLHNIGSYNSHKDAAPFRTRSFHFFNELCQIYAKDRASGKDAQTAVDIIEEIQTEGNDELNDGRNIDFEDEGHTILGFDKLEMSFTPRTSTSSKKRKENEMNEPIFAETLINATIV